jgi:hypothetical protein
MIGRVFATAATFGLAVVAFWSGALGGGHIANPVGIMLLFAAAVAWFAWPTIREGFKAARDESDLPVIRLAGSALAGLRSMMRGREPHRSPSS